MTRLPRSVRLISIALLCALFVLVLAAMGALETLESKSWDTRVTLLTTPEPARHVAILAVDQTSLDYMADEEGITWPWPRQLYVPLIEYCRSAGAHAVVFDILFTEASAFGNEDDGLLASSISAGNDIVLAAVAGKDGTVNGPIDVLARSAASLANVRFEPDADGVFRRLAPYAKTSSGLLASLPVAAADYAADVPLASFRLDPDERMIVRYLGPSGTVPTYTAASAIQSYQRQEFGGGEIPLDPGALKNRIVFVGLTAPGLFDLRPTPIDPVFAGVEVNATATENLMTASLVSPPRTWQLVAGSVLLAIVVAAAMIGWKSAWAGMLGLLAAIGLLLASVTVAFHSGAWLPFVAPLASALAAFIGLQTSEYVIEGRQRRFLRHAFKHYLSPAVIDELVEHPEQLELGGQRRDLSIFFSDLAGFTAISESLEPEALSALLNEYLTAMTDVIHAEGGTVDKFEGDAIIAFWNAPVHQVDHATRALRAAINCQLALREIQPVLSRWVERPLVMRIGVHTGSVVVGNFGSKDRFDYTIIGDAANLASRLEGLCKQVDVPILASAHSIERAPSIRARKLGAVRVAGRSEPVTVCQPLGVDGGPTLTAEDDTAAPWEGVLTATGK